MAEADWKLFRKVQGEALQRLCNRVLEDLVDTAGDTSLTPHERYLKVYKKVHGYDEEIALAFNDSRRSRMVEQLAVMKSLNLLDESELAGFSEETRQILERMSGSF